jgi:predicted DNA binding CopG/RHH family protein
VTGRTTCAMFVRCSALALDRQAHTYYDEFMKRTIQGKEVDEAQIDAWVAEAEAGYDVEDLRRRWGRAPRGSEAAQVIPVRLTAEELAAVMARAEREGLNRSEAIRAALDAWSHVA